MESIPRYKKQNWTRERAKEADLLTGNFIIIRTTASTVSSFTTSRIVSLLLRNISRHATRCQTLKPYY